MFVLLTFICKSVCVVVSLFVFGYVSKKKRKGQRERKQRGIYATVLIAMRKMYLYSSFSEYLLFFNNSFKANNIKKHIKSIWWRAEMYSSTGGRNTRIL